MLTANPATSAKLRLSEEYKHVLNRLNLRGCSDKLLYFPEAGAADMVDLLLDHDDVGILHFSGHGKPGHIEFEGGDGSVELADESALEQAVADFGQITCVLLNACYSATLAVRLGKHVEWVVGMSGRIDDDVAISFSGRFYAALASGRAVDEAFRIALAGCRLGDCDHADVPKIYWKGKLLERATLRPTHPTKERQMPQVSVPAPALGEAHTVELDRILERSPFVLFAGLEIPELAGVPTTPDLVQMLLRSLPPDVPDRRREELKSLSRRPDLCDAFSEFERELTTPKFSSLIEDALGSVHNIPEVLDALATLHPVLRGVVTPSMDYLIDQAFQGKLAPFTKATPRLGFQKNWIFKLHGTLVDRSSWALTRRGRNRTLYEDVYQEPAFISIFVNQTVLFVGADFQSPMLNSIVARMSSISRDLPPKHWALLPATDVDAPMRVKLAEAGVTVIPYFDNSERLHIIRSLRDRHCGQTD